MNSNGSRARPVIFCLDGSLRGCTFSPESDPVVLGSDPACTIRFPPVRDQAIAPRHSQIRREGGGFVIETLCGEPILVNEVPLPRAALDQNDLLRLGEGGPVLRFRSSGGRKVTKSFQQIVMDSRDYASRFEGGRRKTRFSTFARKIVREAVSHSTRRFRIGFAVLLGLVVTLACALVLTKAAADEDSRILQERIAGEKARSEHAMAVTERLRNLLESERAERVGLEEALDTLRETLEQKSQADFLDMKTLRDRAERAEKGLTELSRDVSAAPEIHQRYARGVAFIAVGVSYYSPRRKAFLRYEIDPDTGKRVGAEALSFTGKGEKYVEWCMGSGFIVSKDGLVLTNRHVVDPWFEDDEFGQAWTNIGCRFVRERFLAFFPERAEPVEIVRVAAHPDADLALVRMVPPDPDLPVLDLAPADRPPRVGQNTILLGYPAGYRGLLAKLHASAAKELLKDGIPEFEPAMRTIARLGGIRGTMTQGVLSAVTPGQLVYEAGTTSGGSGGPLFSPEGHVIAVNMAITQFQGANLGVSIDAARSFLASGPFPPQAWDGPELRPEEIELAPPSDGK